MAEREEERGRRRWALHGVLGITTFRNMVWEILVMIAIYELGID